MPRLTTQTTPEATDCGLRWVASHTYNLTRRIPECFPGFRTQMRLAWLIYKLVIKLNTPFTCTTKWNLVVHFTNRDHPEQIVFWEVFWIPCNLHFTNLIVGQMSPRCTNLMHAQMPNSSDYFASNNLIALYIILPSHIIPIWHIRADSDNSCSEMASIKCMLSPHQSNMHQKVDYRFLQFSSSISQRFKHGT